MPGATSVGSLPTNGVKMRPSLTSACPSGAISMNCGTMASPRGNGCVAGRCLPRLLRDGLLVDADERLAGLTIEDVRPAGLSHFDDRLSRATCKVHVHEDDWIDRVVVPDVVMHLLKVPAILAGGELDGEHRRRIQVVAGAEGAVVVRRGIAGREIDETELEIDGRRLPDRSAAVLPGVVVLRPRIVTRLAGARNRVERPDEAAVLRVVRLEAAARAAIAASKADDDHACLERRGADVQRRGGNREVLLPALRLDRPRHLPALAIERQELAIELTDEDSVLADRDALVVPAAADGGDVRVELGFVLPQDVAAVD